MEAIQQQQDFKPFAIPVKMGLLIAGLKIILAYIQYSMFLNDWMLSMLITFISFCLGIGLLVYTGILQRKALGGFIDIKQGFQAMFVTILIMAVLINTFDTIYAEYIDPDMAVKIKDASIAKAEQWGAPQETLDQMAVSFDEQNAGKVSFGKILVGYLSSIVMYSIVGIIIAASISKKKPLEVA
jgi:hypothetical protein